MSILAGAFRRGLRIWCICLLTTAFRAALAQERPETNALWEGLEGIPPQGSAEAAVHPGALSAFRLRHSVLQSMLDQAPKESKERLEASASLISLPMPDGTLEKFRFVESPVMAPELAARFPQIRTFAGRGIDDPNARVRFDVTPAGFHAQILSLRGAVYVEPYFRGNTNVYAAFYKRDLRRPADGFHCVAPESESVPQASTRAAQVSPSGNYPRTYRLACAATAEYTQYFGGTVADGLAAVVTAINRVSGVYESELAIRLVLVANNDQIIYTNTATEPYTDSNAALLLSQNQANVDAVIGSANYDVGHVFGTQGGGLAMVGVVGVAGLKAEGETGAYPPVGDGFYIDYVAHELGHQFGAHHVFNSATDDCGGTSRNAATAYEPGSGSTIMSYAGICGGDDLQPHSDPYFHSASLEEILGFTTSGMGKNCAVVSSVTNATPGINAGSDYVIPMGTPFTLTATGGDSDGDALTYCWEERDLGPAVALTAPDDGSSPLFRSFLPTNTPARTFPEWSDILGNTTTAGEALPTTSRTMSFRVTARDESMTVGATAYSDMQVTVTSNAGPFVVTAPSAGVVWSGEQTVTWDVAGTAYPPVNATNVAILLSIDGGLTFPFVLATNVPNSGSQVVLLPNLRTSTARIEVAAEDNIFFAVSPADFSIMAVSSELAMGQEPSAPAVSVGSNVTFSISLTNFGPRAVAHVVVRDFLPPQLELVSTMSSQGICRLRKGVLECALGKMINGNCAEITVVARVIAPGAATNIVTVSTTGLTNCVVINAPDGIPLLAPIADQMIHAGATLTITNWAAAPGVVSAGLTFSLDPGAPAGAGINPATGVFTWATSAADANTTRPITVRVTDNASPDLSASQSFNVSVISAPFFQPLVCANGAIHASWSAIPGRKYRVQYKENLADSNWTDLQPDVVASGLVATASDPIAAAGQRFYRILVVQ